MSSTEQSHPHSKKLNKDKNKCRLHLRHLHIRNHRRSALDIPNIHTNVSNDSEGNQSSKSLSEQEIQQRHLIQQYIFSKLEAYANKPRIWQLTHSSHIKERLLDKSRNISNLYSLPNDFVRESINQLFSSVDKYVLQLRRLVHPASCESVELNVLFQKTGEPNNQWHSLQLERAKQIFPNINNEEFTENELLQKYYIHIIETLTPKPDTASSNCIAQLREQPFDLNHAYEQAKNKGKECLAQMLEKYRARLKPDLELIQEMINLGLEQMKTRPATEDFEGATNFLTKASMFHKTKQAYESDLHNMGDDFMLLRFGKVFGENALPTTARSNKQFIYLVHLFIKSVLYLTIMMRTTPDTNERIPSVIKAAIGNVFSPEVNSSLIKLDNDDLFSPKSNVDQWTWLLEKWRDSLRTFPIILTEVGAFTRLLRTTIGMGIARLFSFAETIVTNNQILDLAVMNEQLFHALQTGFYFGVAYAIVDCIQDEIQNPDIISSQHLAALKIETNENSRLLTPIEALDKWILIMEEILSGGEFNRKEIPKTPLTPLLLETFDSLITLTKSINATCSAFNELALLLRSQRMDKKTMGNFYTDEELFLGNIFF
ncbi:unnamed protein product [Rotaria sp. Silwood2]|nr:unnamed protein product [Rotaria sp. Silwood2]CAF4379949.1 unnamed protein product [Rotaria sp. Silwood2]